MPRPSALWLPESQARARNGSASCPARSTRARPGSGLLLDRDRPSVQAGAGREPRTARQHVPDRQHDAEVDVLDVRCAVEPVVGRAHQHPADRAERPAEIRVLQRADAHVDRDEHQGRSGRAGISATTGTVASRNPVVCMSGWPRWRAGRGSTRPGRGAGRPCSRTSPGTAVATSDLRSPRAGPGSAQRASWTPRLRYRCELAATARQLTCISPCVCPSFIGDTERGMGGTG